MLVRALLFASLVGCTFSFFEASGERSAWKGWRRPPPPGPHFPAPWMHHHHRFRPPPPPFLKNATEEARKEFFQIFSNENLTKAEVKEKVQEWASKQPEDIQEAASEFHQKMEQMKDETKQNVTAVVLTLQNAIQTFFNIKEDESLTCKETHQKLREAAQSMDRDVAFAASMIVKNAKRRMFRKYFPRPENKECPWCGGENSIEGGNFPGGPPPPPPFGGFPHFPPPTPFGMPPPPHFGSMPPPFGGMPPPPPYGSMPPPPPPFGPPPPPPPSDEFSDL